MERILIVEDSATQREMLRHTLATQGYDVVTAADGADAWARLAAIAPTLVVTDIIMPGMDGYALCRAIKQDPEFAALPVVLLTSLSDAKDVIAALECGADGFIGKPFADDYLLARIRGVIANRDLPERDKREQGVEISHEGRTHLITAERQQILDLLLSVYDVAMRRNADLVQAQASLRKLNAELEQKVQDRTRKFQESNKALETFCYSVAHDLRAPLRSIQGYVSMLGEETEHPTTEGLKTCVERTRTAASRMDRMIVDLLAYGRVSHADIPMEWVDLRAEIDRVIAEFADDIATKQAQVSVEAAPVRFWTSRVLLAQVLGNLVGNALKFVRAGERPRVEVIAYLAPNGVRLAVRDHGIGIDLAYREKIFRIFEKVHNEPFPGTGIGLAIVHKAVERLGGSVRVESESGKGSAFTVELPGQHAPA
jgi:signal transduction histidine kinase